MDSLCAYSNALGPPNQGLHSARVGGLAFFDLLATALLAVVIAAGAFRRKSFKSFASFLSVVFLVFMLLMTLAVGVHELFCVNTRLNALLFNRPWCVAGPAAPRGNGKSGTAPPGHPLDA